MKCRVLSLLLAFALLLGLFPVANAALDSPSNTIPPTPIVEGACPHNLSEGLVSPDYVRPSYSGKLINITPQRVEDTFDYLQEHYVENHPEAALEINTGSEEDRKVLLTLAQKITADCKNDTEKANAVDTWLRDNIAYDTEASAYASDTFYDRAGNCLSYANLMQYLLRSLGIPAVVGDGWRGDMSSATIDLFGQDGHAWCFVLLGGQWVLYDPLWLEGGTTDRKYMEKWMYLDTVEFVTPASDGNNLPPESYKNPKVYYTDGTFYNFSSAVPSGYFNFNMIVNNMPINFTSYQDDRATGGSNDGIIYLDGRDKSGMKLGEIYRGGWLAYGNAKKSRHLTLTYTYSNGMQLSGTVQTLNDTLYYTNGFYSYPIEARDGIWSIQYGNFTLPTGYTGGYLGHPWGDRVFLEGDTLVIQSLNPEVATVDENNQITTISEGICQIAYQHVSPSGTVNSLGYSTILVSDAVRTPDYGGTTPTEPVENPFTDVPDGTYFHAPVLWAYDNNITTGTSPSKFSPEKGCTRGQIVTFLWRAAGCPEPTSTVNPFTDVSEGSFYYKAVLWAVENNVTTGMNKTTFAPNKTCTRAQVVTFMHRAVGSPAPNSSNIPFGDVPADAYYSSAVLWAVENDITTGVNKTTFAPNKTCTRGQIVTFLYRGYAE